MSRAEVPFSEVLAAVRAYLPDSGGVLAADHTLFAALREQLHLDFAAGGPAGGLGYIDSRAQERFSGQVSRALNKLADEGTLRKAGLGSTGPDGREVYRNDVCWYTPAAWDAAAARAADQQAAAAAEAHRWEAIGVRLAALGLPRPVRPSPPLLTPEDWEALLGLAEAAHGKIRVIPDETGQGRVRAEYAGRRTAWPAGQPVMVAEVIAEFAGLDG